MDVLLLETQPALFTGEKFRPLRWVWMSRSLMMMEGGLWKVRKVNSFAATPSLQCHSNFGTIQTEASITALTLNVSLESGTTGTSPNGPLKEEWLLGADPMRH